MSAARLLVNPEELSDWQRGAVDVLDDEAAGYTDTYALQALTAAQGVLASVLGYQPLFHKTARYRLRFRRPPVEEGSLTTVGYLPLVDEVYRAWGTGGPIVVVTTDPYRPTGEATGYYTTAISADMSEVEVFESDILPPAADLIEGWRGSHHVLELGVSPGTYETEVADVVPGLEVLPPLVPDELKTAICEAAVYIARRADRAGVFSSELDLGAQVKRTETLAALNDVNTLIGRTPELVALMRTYAHRYRRFNG